MFRLCNNSCYWVEDLLAFIETTLTPFTPFQVIDGMKRFAPTAAL